MKINCNEISSYLTFFPGKKTKMNLLPHVIIQEYSTFENF